MRLSPFSSTVDSLPSSLLVLPLHLPIHAVLLVICRIILLPICRPVLFHLCVYLYASDAMGLSVFISLNAFQIRLAVAITTKDVYTSTTTMYFEEGCSEGQFRGELSELDDAGTYYDLGPKKVTAAGVSHYMCTRNNNFSNRSQKGKLIVVSHAVAEAQLGATGGRLALPNGQVVITVGESVFSDLTFITVEQWPADVGHQKIEDAGKSMNLGSGYASDFAVITPEREITAENQLFEVKMQLNSAQNAKIYRSYSQHFSSWELVESEVEDNMAVFKVSSGGVYVARSGSNAGAIAGGVIAALLVVVIIVATVIYFRKKPEKWESVSRRFRNAKRGTQANI